MKSCRAILIAGPTASGKSALAIEIAERYGGVVINADSMQVYRELRILTARPSPAEEARVPHRLFGFVPAREAYSVGRYVTDAAAAVAEVQAEGKLPVLVGGTGLYFKALLEGLSPIPPISPDVRQHWRDEAGRLGAEALHRALTERDAEMAARLSPGDTQRIVRALEVLDSTGQSLAVWQTIRGQGVLSEDETVRLVLLPEREALYRRIETRFDRMISDGVLDEVRALQALDLDPALPVMTAHGVPALMSALTGTMAMEDAISAAKADTRHYAKRQFTWLKRNMIAWSSFNLQQMQSSLRLLDLSINI
ncbi:tRNA (adenosine(37)-N6)-dimethylallyltransferase MiaA [Leptospira interrogans]